MNSTAIIAAAEAELDELEFAYDFAIRCEEFEAADDIARQIVEAREEIAERHCPWLF